jgi:hypothetical protein
LFVIPLRLCLSFRSAAEESAFLTDLPATIIPNPPHQNPTPNKLYYGDNLAVLHDYIPSSSVASDAGFYTSSDGTKYPRLQLLTIKELPEGTKSVQHPLHVRDVTFKKAPRSRAAPAENLTLNLTPEG